MKLTFLLLVPALVGLGVLSARPEPPLPLCRVEAVWQPAPWANAPGGLPFGYIVVTTVPDCAGHAFVRLSNYGGRYPGEPLEVLPRVAQKLGPVPVYRQLEWLAGSGKPYRVAVRGSP
ncbi:hypothetical protein FNU79_16200 [Deinococcus detaillensis]|uniref:Uncharacterized protein n=1 Tax=Deinococcus detaillensis TaxID=2592048 RepID=A0A553UKQ4_9DEIO|nr:hypothetical protein [Deinococcus detaillensis]TSA80784.1 hypothetical protein FNU79_16200 [Deinococcus detaillensis]